MLLAVASDPIIRLLVAGTGALLLVAILLWRRSAGSYYLLVFAALALSRLTVDVAGVTLRTDQVAVLLLFLPIFGLSAVRESTQFGTHRLIGRLLIGYLLVGVFSRAAAGGTASEIGRSSAILGLAIAAYWVPPALVHRGIGLSNLTRCVVGVGALSGMFASLAGFASYFVDGVPGVQTDGSNSSLHLAYGTFFEANLLGAFLAGSLILAVLDRSCISWGPEWRTLAQIAIAAGLLATFTRGAWVAFFVGVVATMVALRSGSSRWRRRFLVRLAGFLLMSVFVVSLIGPLREVFVIRLSGLLDFSSGSGYGRTRIAALALDEWRSSRLIGHGFLSFDTRLPGAREGLGAWIPNLAVAVLHDTGVFGAVLFSLAVVLTLRRLWAQPNRTVGAPWLGVAVALLVASLATQSQVLPFFWFLLGMATLAAERAAVDPKVKVMTCRPPTAGDRPLTW